MKLKKKQKGYPWKFSSVGGSVRVNITSGEDIAHLGELDRKLWTVLSCPTKGLEFDAKTLAYIDTDSDGKIRVDEVIAAAKWLTDVLKDRDLLIKGEGLLPLAAFNEESPEGAKLLASAKQILSNLSLEKDEITLEEASDSVKIFEKTQFNGDGIITPASADDESLQALIAKIVEVLGGAPDRSGVDGIDEAKVEAFYAACADYAAWQDARTADVLPYGEDTEAALAACDALKEKIADYFMRCKLIGFNPDCAGAVDVSVEKIGAISGEDLAAAAEIGSYPLARPSAAGLLPLGGGINPAWQGAFATLKALVLDKDFPKAKGITEAEWNGVLAKFAPYIAWKDAKKGAEVEAVGLDEIKAILKADKKAALLDLIAKDKALEEESLSIDAVGKLLYLVRDFFAFLNNYIVFKDFYDKDKKMKAIFQAGRLYIDQRSTDLCIKIQDMGKVGELATHSGMYILICACSSKVKNATMNIAAVLTKGDVDDIREGKNAIFYDRDGGDWDATVTKIIDNPISIRQAFWAPYKKIGRWISDKVNKAASEKNDKALADTTTKLDTASAAPAGEGAAAVKSSFDIAKFAGIFAAIGMALGFIGQALVALAKGVTSTPAWKILAIICGIILVISLPSMFLAWRKLRRRDLGPVLNANGWAINAKALVRIKFGATLNSLAKYPKLTAVDKAARRRARWRRFFWCLFAAIVIAGAALYFTDNLKCIGLPFHKEAPVEEVVEAPEAAEAEASAEPAAEPAAEAVEEAAPEA